MDVDTAQIAQQLVSLPASVRVRDTASELLRIEWRRFGATTGTLLVTEPVSGRLWSVVWRGGAADGRTGSGWRVPDTSPVARTAMDGRARFVVSTDDQSWRDGGMRMPGAASAVTLPLDEEGSTVGVVVLWMDTATRPAAAEEPGWHARVAVSAAPLRLAQQLDQQEQWALQLRGAVARHGVVEQAKGVLAAYLHTSPNDAYERLQRYCDRSGMRVHPVAESIIGQAMVGPVSALPLLDL